MEPLGNGVAVLDRVEGGLSYLVVSLIPEGSPCGLALAATPAGVSQRQASSVTSHVDKLATPGVVSRELFKLYPQASPAPTPDHLAREQATSIPADDLHAISEVHSSGRRVGTGVDGQSRASFSRDSVDSRGNGPHLAHLQSSAYHRELPADQVLRLWVRGRR